MMKIKQIKTVDELIKILKKYPLDTELSHLTGDRDTSKTLGPLYLYETHPIGDRDAEDILLLAFSSDPEPDKL